MTLRSGRILPQSNFGHQTSITIFQFCGLTYDVSFRANPYNDTYQMTRLYISNQPESSSPNVQAISDENEASAANLILVCTPIYVLPVRTPYQHIPCVYIFMVFVVVKTIKRKVQPDRKLARNLYLQNLCYRRTSCYPQNTYKVDNSTYLYLLQQWLDIILSKQ